jgi:PAS domain S-box-containing protein
MQLDRILEEREEPETEARLRWWAKASVTVAVLLTVLLSLLSWRAAQQATETTDWVAHTYEVMTVLESALRHSLDVETGGRGFAETGTIPFLEPYESGRSAVVQDLHALRPLLVTPDQLRRLNALEEQTNNQVEDVEAIVATRQNMGKIPTVALFEQEKQDMDAARITVEQMEMAERGLLVLRTQRARAAQHSSSVVIALGSLLGVIFLSIAGTTVSREIGVSARARAQIKALNAGLERRVEQRTAALQSEVAVRKRAEEIRERLAAIVDSSDDAIISKTLDGTISAWNGGAEKIFGYSASDAVGKPMLMLFPAERMDEEADILARMRRDESAQHFETVRVRKDGTRIDVSVTISPIRDANGAVVGASNVARDITERKLKEEALRESEERFQVMANGIQQLAWMANADGSIFWYNQRWYDYTGTTLEETRGWTWEKIHDPAFLPNVLDRWKEAIATGTPFDMEFPLRGTDGSFHMFLTRIMPVRNSEGRVVRWLGTHTDISDRKKAEEQLAESAVALARQAEDLVLSRGDLEAQTSMLKLVLESMGEGLVAVDEQGKFILWNPAAEKIVGLGPTNLPSGEWGAHYGLFLPDMVTPIPPGETPLERTLRGEAVSTEFFLSHAGVNPGVWLEANGSPLIDKDGARRGGVLAFRDISRRKTDELVIRSLNEELEERIAKRTEQLEASNHELEAFSYSVSHDLRTPLRHVAGFARILVNDFGPGMAVEERAHLQRIEDAVSRMGLLIDALLKMAVLRRQSLRPCRSELNPIVDDVISMLKPECDGREVEWRIAKLPALDCDPILMAQVFQNLLGNALKYSRGRDKAVIEVGSIQRPSEPAIIFVRDNGAGFNMKYAERLFGVFQRFHTDSEFEGTGVGLATVHRIVQKHGGTIWAESEVDHGATFYFALQMTEQIGTTLKATGETGTGKTSPDETATIVSGRIRGSNLE